MKDLDHMPDHRGSNVPTILLTDTNRWALPARLAIGLSKAGCNVAALCPVQGHPLSKTSVVRQIFPYGGLRPLESLTTAIEATRPTLIVPCDDRGVEHLHELYARVLHMGARGDSIRHLIERSLGNPQSYPTVSARYELLKAAREEGLRAPETRPIKTTEDLAQLEATQPFPWVLKADGTFGGRGVKIARSLNEAVQCFHELTRLYGAGRVFKRLFVNRDAFWLRPWWNGTRPAVIVQAHIQGHPANCAVVAWQGKVLACIGVEVLHSEGNTGPASVVRIVDNPDMMKAAERIAARLCLSGFFGLDFVIEAGTRAAYLIEMNPRCTPPCHLQLGKGRDMVGALAAELSGQPFRPKPPITQNDLVAYFPQAWNPESEHLKASFQDIPEDEPGLVQELLNPWPDRSFLFRASNYVHELTAFATALVARKPTGLSRSKV